MGKWIAAVLAAVMLFCEGTGPALAAEAAKPAEAPKVSTRIVINLASRFLSLYVNGVKTAMYPIGAGKLATPTPLGNYKIIEKEENPTWVDPKDSKKKVESGEDNPLGYRWMRFVDDYGIHGTNKPESVGSYVSNGCIRLREADVEQLYQAVSMGTPVEVRYDRVVIEKLADDTVVYYIYPDGYSWQPLTIAKVNQMLAGYGVAAFESDAAISDKLLASDGQPTYVAKSFAIEVNGLWISGKAVESEGVLYLPAQPLARVLKLKLDWNADTGLLTTPYGSVPGVLKKNTLFLDAQDVEKLFQVTGALDARQVLVLTSEKAAAAPAAPATVPEAPAAAAVQAAGIAEPAAAPVGAATNVKANPQQPATAKAAAQH